MSKDRPDRLYYTGDGREFFVGVPARDLEERDIAPLSDAQLADITADNPATGKSLYQKTEPASRTPDPPASKRESGPTGREGPPAESRAARSE